MVPLNTRRLSRMPLAWIPPGGGSKVAIPRSHLRGRDDGQEATGVSVDAAGKVWAGCYGSHNAMRIDPNGGEMVVTNGVTNFVGGVDLVVNLGNGTGHPEPYNVEAQPYNYSDMTGFNNRIVNPGLQPLKGYWAVVHDCGIAGEWWRQVTWTDNLPLSGCAVEVQVRADDDRQELVNRAFVPVTNGGAIVGVKGRYIEVRVALVRDAPDKQPVLYDLTLHGQSSGFVGESFLEPAAAYETWDTWFWVDLEGPEPVTYQWFVLYPWTNQFQMMAGETNWYLHWPDADQWEDGSWVSLSVSNGAGETLVLGPANLSVYPLPITIPGSLTNSMGAASRYPATIDVRGEPTNGLAAVWVTLGDLEHDYPSDMDILLVSPSGATVMLISSAGSYVTTTNATLVFQPNWLAPNAAPYQSAIPSGQESQYRGSNHGGLTSLPGAPNPSSPSGEYWTDLDRLTLTDPDPNGVWRLYIYDHKQGDRGELHDSWRLEFFY